MNLKDILEVEEGFRSKPYLCSEGYVTVGYGTKIHKRKGMNPKDFTITVSRSMATSMLLRDVAKLEAALVKSKYGEVFQSLDADRRAIVLSMSYQMGVQGVLGFPAMWRNAQKQDWEGMGREALDSLWARIQTPERAGRHARVLAGETIKQVYGE